MVIWYKGFIFNLRTTVVILYDQYFIKSVCFYNEDLRTVGRNSRIVKSKWRWGSIGKKKEETKREDFCIYWRLYYSGKIRWEKDKGRRSPLMIGLKPHIMRNKNKKRNYLGVRITSYLRRCTTKKRHRQIKGSFSLFLGKSSESVLKRYIKSDTTPKSIKNRLFIYN